jgi:hypothetical protein
METVTKAAKSQITRAFGKWSEEYISRGWQCYLTTFMFNPLSGSREGIVRQMSKEVERVYSTLLTRVVRDPRSPKVKGSLPILIGFPDLPVFKHNKGRLQDVVINDGLHYHAMVLLPPRSRLKESLVQHFERCQDMYLGKIKTKKVAGRLRSKRVASKLQHIHTQATTYTPRNHTGYGLKAMGKLDHDHLLILPKSHGETTPRVVEEIPHEPIWW